MLAGVCVACTFSLVLLVESQPINKAASPNIGAPISFFIILILVIIKKVCMTITIVIQIRVNERDVRAFPLVREASLESVCLCAQQFTLSIDNASPANISVGIICCAIMNAENSLRERVQAPDVASPFINKC